MDLSSWLEFQRNPLQQTILGPNWRAPPGPRSGRVAKQRELAKRVVAKQQVCASRQGARSAAVATEPVQAVDCGLIFSSGVTYSGST